MDKCLVCREKFQIKWCSCLFGPSTSVILFAASDLRKCFFEKSMDLLQVLLQ